MFRLFSAAFRFCTLGVWSAVIFTAMAAGAQANEKIVFATNWYAQAEHGGFYQAIAEGIYAQHGLDVEIRMGGPQVNGMQLLAAGSNLTTRRRPGALVLIGRTWGSQRCSL